MLVNQWYLMRFECYLTEIASIEKRIVEHRGSALTEAERIHFYQTLLGAVKDADGNSIFPIPRIDSVGEITDAYTILGMKPPFSSGSNNLWNQLYLSTSTQTTLPS
ncbi:MAG: hypothetical protein ACTSYU_12175 [Promethearchaeota archaeon]